MSKLKAVNTGHDSNFNSLAVQFQDGQNFIATFIGQKIKSDQYLADTPQRVSSNLRKLADAIDEHYGEQ